MPEPFTTVKCTYQVESRTIHFKRSFFATIQMLTTGKWKTQWLVSERLYCDLWWFFLVVRGLHCMTTHRDRLYVFGGNHFRGSSGMFLSSAWPKMTTIYFFGQSCTLFSRYSQNWTFFTDYDDVLECEYYLPRTDQWVKVAPMLTGQSDVGIAVYNDRIYVTGGYR